MADTSDPDYGNNIATTFRGYVDRIVNLQEQIKDLQSDCGSVYREAKGSGFDKDGIKSVVARLRMDGIERQTKEYYRDAYWLLYQGKTEVLLQGPPVRPENAEPEQEKAASGGNHSPAPTGGAATSNGAEPEAAPSPEKPKKLRKARATKVDVRTPEPEEPELPMPPAAVTTQDTGMPEDLLDPPFDPETGEILDPDGNPLDPGEPPEPETIVGLLDDLPEPVPEADQPPLIPAILRRPTASEAAAEQIAAAKASASRASAGGGARARAEPEEPDLPDGF